MESYPEITEPEPPRRTFGLLGVDSAQRMLRRSQRELLATSASVDAHTAELRDRIFAASRLRLIGSLLLLRR